MDGPKSSFQWELETSYYSVHNPVIILKEMPKSMFFFSPQNIMDRWMLFLFLIQVTNKEMNLALKAYLQSQGKIGKWVNKKFCRCAP